MNTSFNALPLGKNQMLGNSPYPNGEMGCVLQAIDQAEDALAEKLKGHPDGAAVILGKTDAWLLIERNGERVVAHAVPDANDVTVLTEITTLDSMGLDYFDKDISDVEGYLASLEAATDQFVLIQANLEKMVVLNLTGIWAEIEANLFARQFNDGAAWIEVSLHGAKAMFRAKLSGNLGSVPTISQCIAEKMVSAFDEDMIEKTVDVLERRLGNMLQLLGQPTQHLDCCCCGGGAIGRQWYNRDEGYGICPKCIIFLSDRETPAEMLSNYGVAGIHYNVASNNSAGSRGTGQ